MKHVFILPLLLLAASCSEQPVSGESRAATTDSTATSPSADVSPQTRQLPTPEKAFMDSSEYRSEADYDYLVRYIGSSSKKVVKARESYDDRPVCKWEQQFRNGILYESDDCGDEGGVTFRVTFPGYAKSELVRFIDWCYRTDGNSWDKHQTIYQPAEGGAGCYYNIVKNASGNYCIEGWCGC